MTFRNHRSSALFGAALALAVAQGAHAALVEHATFSNVVPGRDVSVHLTDRFFTTAVNFDDNTRAGKFDWTGTPDSPIAGTFTTFCIDFGQNIGYGGSYDYDVEALEQGAKPYGPNEGNPVGGSGASFGLGTDRTRSTLLRQLWARYYDNLGDDPDASAAFQLTVWKLLYETDPNAYTDITAGDLHVYGDSTAGAFVPIANSYLAFLTNPANEFAPQETRLVALTSSSVQDQMTVIPEPASASLTVAPAAALLLARRRRRA